MAEMRYLMVRLETGDRSPYCTLGEVAYRAGLHPELVERFIRLGLIEFTETGDGGEMLFDASVVPLIRRIMRLRNQLGVNYAGVGVILELLSQLDIMESRIEELERRLASL